MAVMESLLASSSGSLAYFPTSVSLIEFLRRNNRGAFQRIYRRVNAVQEGYPCRTNIRSAKRMYQIDRPKRKRDSLSGSVQGGIRKPAARISPVVYLWV